MRKDESICRRTHIALRRLFGLWLALLVIAPACAQFYIGGTEPLNGPLKQIVLPPFRVIYQPHQDSLAGLAADYLARYHHLTALSKQRNRPFPILLRGLTPNANGMVAWTPSRMELYPLTAGELATPRPWLQHLVAHEIRHYAQMEALDKAWFRALYFLLGQANVALASAIAPPWLLEGDAIHSESRFGRFGRAMEANHLQAYRADLLNGTPRNYDQYLNRSFRYYMPNHYTFGSLLVEYAYDRYGEQFWPQVFEYATRHLHYILPYHFALKKYAGVGIRNLFDSAFLALDSVFRQRTEPGELPPAEPLAHFEDQRYPHLDPNAHYLYYWHWDLSHTMGLYRLDQATHTKKRLLRPGSLLGRPRYRNNLVIWPEFRQHSRWALLASADVYLASLPAGKLRRLTRGAMLLSPDILHGDSTFTAISVAPNGHQELQMRALANGRLLRTAKIHQSLELREAVNHTSKQLTLLRAVNDQGTLLFAYCWDTDSLIALLPPQLLDISNLQPTDSGFFFTMSHRGRIQPYFASTDGVHPPTQFYRIPLANHGVEDLNTRTPASLMLARYTVNGYRYQQLDSLAPEPVLELKPAEPIFPLRPVDHGPHTPDSLARPVRSKPYSRFTHAIRVHSWAPLHFDALGGAPAPTWGFSLYSQNSLGSLAATASYFYNGYHGAQLHVLYDALWPRIEAQIVYGGARSVTYSTQSAYSNDLALQGTLALNLPLQLRQGAWSFYLAPLVAIQATNDTYSPPSTPSAFQGLLKLRYGLTSSATQVKALRDLYPRFGLQLSAYGVHVLFPQALFGELLRASTTLYLPGFYTNHSFRLSGSYVDQTHATYRALFTAPSRGRGLFPSALGQDATKAWMAAADYTLPLAYPDLRWGVLAYFKRIYLNLSGAYTRFRSNSNGWQQLRAIGLSWGIDLHLLRLPPMISILLSANYSPWGDHLSKLKPYNWGFDVDFNVSL